MFKYRASIVAFAMVFSLVIQASAQNQRAQWREMLKNSSPQTNPKENSVSSELVSVESNGTFYKISLTHDAVKQLSTKEAAAVIALVTTQIPNIGAFLGASAGVLATLDQVGGNKGVDIVGCVFLTGTLPTSAPWDVYGLLSKLTGNISLSGHIGDALRAGMKYAAREPGVALALGPLGVNVWAAKKVIDKAFGHKEGGLEAKSRSIGSQEKLFLIHLENENKVAFLSVHNGRYLYAPDGGGSSLWAKYPHIKSFEKWDLVENQNGTVSFRSWNGYYIRANGGGGGALNADAKQIGLHEQFWLRFNTDGTSSLQTYAKGLYVKVKS